MQCGAVLLMFVLTASFHEAVCKYSNTRNYEALGNTIEYFPYPETPKITIPIMIHLDPVLTVSLSKQYKRTIKYYFRDVLNSLETIYKYPSLNQTVNFALLDVKMVKNTSRSFQMDGDVSKYLKSYCMWQGRKKKEKDKPYYSVLFTGLELYHWGGKNKKIKSTGRSYVGGVCSLYNSCSILAWRPTNIAYTMAHEIAHSVGMSHDGPPHNHCRVQRNIMHPRYSPGASGWSTCNKESFDSFMLSSKAWCIRDPYATYSSRSFMYYY